MRVSSTLAHEATKLYFSTLEREISKDNSVPVGAKALVSEEISTDKIARLEH